MTFEEEFNYYKEQWTNCPRVRVSSYPEPDHESYRHIIRMGMPVIPLILQSLEQETHLWFGALSSITGADPVPYEDRGRVEKMKRHWLQWGRDNALL